LWDAESWHALAASQMQIARDTGALSQLRAALNFLVTPSILAGELNTASLLIDEDHLVAEATGNPRITYSEMLLVAWRGEGERASALIEATSQEAAARGLGLFASSAAYASSVLNNGLGHHEAARKAALQAFEHEWPGQGPLLLPELSEAASRTGDLALLSTPLAWLSERRRAISNDWLRGIEARVRAFLS